MNHTQVDKGWRHRHLLTGVEPEAEREGEAVETLLARGAHVLRLDRKVVVEIVAACMGEQHPGHARQEL